MKVHNWSEALAKSKLSPERRARVQADVDQELLKMNLQELRKAAGVPRGALMPNVTLPTNEIIDRETFHSACQRVFGFPSFYGRNMDAWIDCMSYLDDAQSAMVSVALEPGELLHVTVPDSEAFEKRVPDVFADFIECTAIVNRRFIDRGSAPRIALLLA